MKDKQYFDGNNQPLKKGVYRYAGSYVLFEGKLPSQSNQPLVCRGVDGNSITLQYSAVEHMFRVDDLKKEKQTLQASLSFLETCS